MVRSVLNLFSICVFLCAFYTSAFNITGPVITGVNTPDNIPVHWIWSRGDPTNVVVNLFVNNISDVCTFGRAYPEASKGIRHFIDGVREVNGRRSGNFSFKANSTGQYILCAYEDLTPANGTLNFRSIANSNVFNVTDTTTAIVMSPPSTATPSGSPGGASTAGQPEKDSNSGTSAGVLAAAIVGGVLFLIAVAAFILFFFAGRLIFPWMTVAREKFYSKVSHSPKFK
ncbi:hypothetical protein Moror_3685 [Moniliophthora roreri MCA 2997]|uniref:Uncharacterized protein n=2 Tax=Moniliophthora roreri TaxID=221103 RepID=V2WPT7_MONRO|nr:hypothetical protein Moror_3685 [Moniliophthora roreri MCA 2997]